MEFLKYRMMKVTVVCLVILILMILCFPFAYHNMVNQNKAETNSQEIVTEQVQETAEAEPETENNDIDFN